VAEAATAVQTTAKKLLAQEVQLQGWWGSGIAAQRLQPASREGPCLLRFHRYGSVQEINFFSCWRHIEAWIDASMLGSFFVSAFSSRKLTGSTNASYTFSNLHREPRPQVGQRNMPGAL
jgi:hypothetical protein